MFIKILGETKMTGNYRDPGDIYIRLVKPIPCLHLCLSQPRRRKDLYDLDVAVLYVIRNPNTLLARRSLQSTSLTPLINKFVVEGGAQHEMESNGACAPVRQSSASNWPSDRPDEHGARSGRSPSRTKRSRLRESAAEVVLFTEKR